MESHNNAPKLRFPEFKDEWDRHVLKELINEYRLGGNYTNTETPSKHPLIKMGNLGRGNINLDKIEYIKEGEQVDEADKIKYGDLFFNTRNTLDLVGKVAVWRDELSTAYYNSNLMLMTFSNNFFMNYRFNSFQGIKALKRIATGTTSVAAIYTKDLLKIELSSPSTSEQQKIASFLTEVDNKIEQLTKTKQLLQDYKKGVMQQIFSQQIRFKQDDGSHYPDWEVKKLGDVFNRIVLKNKENNTNVLTISAQQGLINQEKFFTKSVSAKDVTGYYLLHKGDFAYNKSYSKGYPMGAIKKLNKYQKGVVSTLYICFKVKNKLMEDFYEQYFDSGFQNRELHKIAQEGARNHGLLNMSVVEFFRDIDIPMPIVKEQQKIANFLTDIDNKINLIEQQLAGTKQFKQGLLQQLFV